MKKFILGSLLILTACSGGGGGDSAEPTTNACGLLGLNAKIINGTSCSNPERTGVLRIAILMRDGSVGQCTGSLIAANKVLTAAHCFLDNPVSASVVLESDGGIQGAIQATRVDIHPGFGVKDEKFLQYDVAVMSLKSNSNRPTYPILLGKDYSGGNIVSIFGYGVDDSGSTSSTLKSGEMKIDNVDGSLIFAKFDGTGSNTCFGDSGGPMFGNINGQPGLVGLTSGGENPTCQADDNSSFANLQDSAVVDFILEKAPNAQFL